MKEIVEPDAKSVIGDIMDLQRYVSWEIMQINSDIMRLDSKQASISVLL